MAVRKFLNHSLINIMFRRLDESIKVSKYYGRTRNSDMTEYLNSNMVFTTYHTIAASMDNNKSLIFGIEWFRVVLDECKS